MEQTETCIMGTNKHKLKFHVTACKHLLFRTGLQITYRHAASLFKFLKLVALQLLQRT